MSSRESILKKIKSNQPSPSVLPELRYYKQAFSENLDKYIVTLESIGGYAYRINNTDEILPHLRNRFPDANKIITTLDIFHDEIEKVNPAEDPRIMQDADIAILSAHFGVAENGALWFTDDLMKVRATPYICQHLAVLLPAHKIVPTLHEAYDLIAGTEYGFGGFIAGPSKTADIEQSLVLGAHGPKTMNVFLLEE